MTRTHHALARTRRDLGELQAALRRAEARLEDLNAELAAEVASWPSGAWSEDEATRLAEKGAALNELWGRHDREAADMQCRYREEQRIIDRRDFAAALVNSLKRKVKVA